MVLAAIGKDPRAKYVIGAGSGSNEARLFERESGELVGCMKGMRQVRLRCHTMLDAKS